MLPNQHADEISSRHIPGTSGLNGNGNYDEDMEVIGPANVIPDISTDFGSIYNDVLNTDVSSPKCSEGDPNEEGWDPGSPGTSGLNGNGNYDEDNETNVPANVIPDINVKDEIPEPDDHFDPIVACIMDHKKIETTGKLIFTYFFSNL